MYALAAAVRGPGVSLASSREGEKLEGNRGLPNIGDCRISGSSYGGGDDG